MAKGIEVEVVCKAEVKTVPDARRAKRSHKLLKHIEVGANVVRIGFAIWKQNLSWPKQVAAAMLCSDDRIGGADDLH